MKLPLLEACVGSVADIEAAIRGGAHRFELCGALELGGLTPSTGLVETARAATMLPIVAMLRPRAGGFCYDQHEFAAMLRDAERFLAIGVNGLAFGILDTRGRIDATRCQALVEAAGQSDGVFHRAFDYVTDQTAALDALIELGFTRVLTSGGSATALAGAPALRSLVEHARERIEVMAGGGIRAENVIELILQTDCRQIHVGAATGADDGSIPAQAALGLTDARFVSGTSHRIVDMEQIAEIVAALEEHENRLPGRR